ncbi:hypothetical protein RM533_12725 [Croceicoccus sp. F390]|uniref:Serine kinase n=1 Tax=Croceicoccus esteveae TaxID=3075597 RepID=A0ABU2ZK99_9SPHN|nr:hypothetical protein [Croceicoccus sp. F390]MDT0577032.1 hypothetical protein [Croceicoccus sp. F390]
MKDEAVGGPAPGSRWYKAFGLTIASNVPLEELTAIDAVEAPDVTIRYADLDRPLPAMEDGVVFDYADPLGVYMAWPGVAAFRVCGTDEIQVQPYPDTPRGFLAFPILGPVMAWLLQKRELLVLHASAVEIDGRSVVLMGDKMAGKSTTAAAFVQTGYRLVTDDLLAINVTGGADGKPVMFPAFAQLKLTQQSANAVPITGATALPLVYEGFTKRQHRLPDLYAGTIGADHFFVLHRGGDQPLIAPLASAAGFQALMRFSYSIRFGSAPYTDRERAEQFRNCVTLANRAQIGDLHIPADLARLGETVDLVARHVRKIADR